MASRGQQFLDQAPSQFQHHRVSGNPHFIQQVRATALPAANSHASTLLDEPVLVVNQKAKVFGINTEYAIYNQHGVQVGLVREVGQRVLKKALGAGGENGTHRFQVLDARGHVLLALTRPATLGKSKMLVTGTGSAQGQIVQKNTGFFKNIRFDLVSSGKSVGSIVADGSAAWDFTIRDESDVEIGRITKTWAGWAKERFTKADNYVVQIHRPLNDPLRLLVVAGAVAIDTALKQGKPTKKSGKKGKRRYS